MIKSRRKERFERVSKNRLERALQAIDSLENLSNQSNYEWAQREVDEISGKLMARVKLVMASFGSETAEERFDKLREQDLLQYRLLKEADPDVFQMVKLQLEKNGHILVIESDADIVKKFQILYEELTKQQTKDSSSLKDLLNERYQLNPAFNLSRLSAKHNIARLKWLGPTGRTLEEILSLNSMYRVHPDPDPYKQNPSANLKWDIEHGRVIKIN
tara:strand:+ start:419 stop:1066 length:648 start_codon:yes stop_codon:yes gene_type:complete